MTKGKSKQRTEDVLNFLEPMLKHMLEKDFYNKYFGEGRAEGLKEFAKDHPAAMRGILGALSVVVQRYDPKNPFLSTITEIAEDGISEIGARVLNGDDSGDGKSGNGADRKLKDSKTKNGFLGILGQENIREELRGLIRWFVKLEDEDRVIIKRAIARMDPNELKGFVSLTSMLRLEFCRNLVEKKKSKEKKSDDGFGFADFINKRTEKVKAISTRLAQRR